jgi:1-acyl-sn-glycerol-3-phosphate acyltransferase
MEDCKNNGVTPKKKEKSGKNKSITIKPNKKGRHIIGFINFLRVLVLPTFFLLRPCRYYGNRKVKDGAYIYVSNHYGLMDPAYVAATTWEGIHFVGKKEIFDSKILGGIARKAKAISVNRDGNDVRGLLDCFKCLKNGDKICIYPEGTRNKTDQELLPFHHGAAMMSIKCKTPIIPIVIYSKPKFFRRTDILIGEPFELTEYYDKKLSEEEMGQAAEYLRQHMLEMRRKHTEYLENKKKAK